jgi:hypothetical protein
MSTKWKTWSLMKEAESDSDQYRNRKIIPVPHLNEKLES